MVFWLLIFDIVVAENALPLEDKASERLNID
jgi:hypothetical protein